MNAVAYIFLLVISAVTGDSQVYTLDGGVVDCTIIETDDAGSLLFKDGTGRRSIPLDQIHLIRFPGMGAAEAAQLPCGLLLRQNDYLGGTVAGGDGDRLILDHPLLGRLAVPIDSLRIFLPGRPEIPAGFVPYLRKDLGGDEDVVFRKGEGSVSEDFISGTLDLFSANGITFDCDLGQIEFGYNQLNAVVICAAGTGTEERSDEGGGAARILLLLRGGTGRLSGRFQGIRNKHLILGDSFRETVSIPLGTIDSVVLIRNGIDFLGDMTPSDVKEIPFLGRAGDFLYPFRSDRSVTGRELSAAGRRFAKGLGVHSRCVLTYDLNGAYDSFHAFAGICDEVAGLRARGSMVFRVMVDGKQVFESPVLRGGDPPLRLPVLSMKGAASLTLEADFADAFDTCDRGFWGHALLTR